MTVAILRDFFLWCSIINMGLFLISTLLFKFTHKLIYRIHGKWFGISEEKFNLIYYQAMLYYKIGIFLLNIIPLIALIIIGKYS